MDLVLAVGASLDRAGGADQVARAGKRVGAQAGADVDRGQSRQRDPLRVADHEMRIAVAVGIDPLDVDDPPHRLPTGRMPGGAMRRLDGFGSPSPCETVKMVLGEPFLRSRRFLAGIGGPSGPAAGEWRYGGYDGQCGRGAGQDSQPVPSESESRP